MVVEGVSEEEEEGEEYCESSSLVVSRSLCADDGVSVSSSWPVGVVSISFCKQRQYKTIRRRGFASQSAKRSSRVVQRLVVQRIYINYYY